MTEPSRSAGRRILLADVGGTNVRFALLSGGDLGPIAHLEVRHHATFADALAAYLTQRAEPATPDAAIFAVAGVVTGERCPLTNNPWVVDAAELRARFGIPAIHIINDFEAIGWSLPHFAAADLVTIGGGAPLSGAPMAVLGPGTGLGVAAFVPDAAGGLVLKSEGGHVTAPGASPREDAIIDHLRRRYRHVTAERLLSGPGLENLYSAIAAIDGVTVPQRTAAEITQAALDRACAVCRDTLDVFCALLGDVAGNVALTFGAQGGVFIAGGIGLRIRAFLPASQFRARFEAKGRMSAYVAAIPAHLIVHPDPAFVGLRALAARPVRTT